MTGHPVLRLTLWTSGLIGAIVGLDRLGTGDLGGPPVRGGAPALERWVTTQDPASVLMVVVRSAALCTAIYLLAVTVLALVAHVSRVASLVSLSDRVTVPLVRRMVGSVLGIAVAAGPLAGAPPAWATRLPPPPALTLPVGGSGGRAATAVEVAPPAAAPDPPTLRRLPDDEPAQAVAPGQTQNRPASAPPPRSTSAAPTTTESVTTAPSAISSPTTPAPPAPVPPTGTPSPPAPDSPAATGSALAPDSAAVTGSLSVPTAPPRTTEPAGAPLAPTPPPSIATPGAPEADSSTTAVQAPPATWTVRPGEHLWRISSLALQAARRRPVSDAEIAPYWLAVVERNRSSLPDPANADLLYVGMTVVLPPVP